MDMMQTETEIRQYLEDHEHLKSLRAPWDTLYREIDERVDPQADGPFSGKAPSEERGLDNFDATQIEGLDRFQAAIMGLTVPRNQRWHSLTTPDKDLNRLPAVQRWLEHATDRLFACRSAPSAGFEMMKGADVRQNGKYGTAPLWVDENVGRGLWYKAVHLSEVYINENAQGRVDTAHREYELTVRQIVERFGEAALTDRMARCWTDDNPAKKREKFQLVQVICPNSAYERDDPSWRGKRIKSLTIAVDEKQSIRRGGYRTMPMIVERATGSAGAIYGRSPAMKVLGTIRVLDAMARTLLRAAHKKVDPALAFYDDGQISRLVTRPGGMNPGLVDEQGRLLVQPIPSGADLAWGLDVQDRERKVVKDAFLEQLFQILTDPADRMTATQVLEMIQKQGVLVGPFAGRHETEKLAPMIERELDLLMAAGQIDDMPPEMVEAGVAMPVAIYENPLARMSRAEEAAGFTRWVEVAVQIAAFEPGVFDHINTDRAMTGLAEVLSVRPSWQNSPDEVDAKRRQRQEAEQVAQSTAALPAAASAALDLSRANEIAAGAM